MNKTAIVTGASGGLGSATAKRLARDGFAVVVHYAGKPAPAQAVVAELKAAGGQANRCHCHLVEILCFLS
jgi:3-oxoacyl-[acyl-carrier protein] reductase